MKKLLLLAAVGFIASTTLVGCSSVSPKQAYHGLERVCLHQGPCAFVDRNEFKKLIR